MIELRAVSKIYGANGAQPVEAVHKVSFSVEPEEFVCLLGPSGCGKSTVLHLLAGFIKPSEGLVLVRGASVERPGVDRGVVFQKHSLFPWKTVRENIETGPRIRGWTAEKRHEVVRHYLRETGLDDFSERYPSELSVGMQQRVGLARAFANDPEILLMDEPFGSLDAQTRVLMQELLLTIWTEHRKTVVFVTHDVDEALLLADRILLFSSRPGTVAQQFVVDLPRPRGHDLLADARTMTLKRNILTALFADKRG